ncbi:MAG: right-handed parallel beta-helix repeat-containing protein [Alphaproteobacteria bacterium]
MAIFERKRHGARSPWTARAFRLACIIGLSIFAASPGLGLTPAEKTGARGDDGAATRTFQVSDAAQLDAALAGPAGRAGGVILLETGRYGPLLVRGIEPAAPLLLQPAPGASVVIGRITIQTSSNVILQGLTVRDPLTVKNPNGITRAKSLIAVQRSRRITVRNLDVASTDDASGWSLDDWLAYAKQGIIVKASDDVTIAENRIANVYMGITAQGGANLRILSNTVREFAGDGIRPLADGTLVDSNVIFDCVKVNNNHDDGIQVWAPKNPDREQGRRSPGVVRDIIIRNNTIHQEKTQAPLRCPALQGIALFNGMYDGFLIENNTVAVDHWNGITVFGATRSIIRGNTVRFTPGSTRRRKGKKPTWIEVAPHKNGTPSEAITVENNSAHRFRLESVVGLTERGNREIEIGE